MELFQCTTSKWFSSFTSFCRFDSLYQLDYVHETLPPPASFPQFSRLPIEIRIRIWELSLEPRIIFLHLHKHDSHDVLPDDNLDSDVGSSGEDTRVALVGNEEEAENQPELGNMRLRGDTMSITNCTQSHPCGCRSFPPNSSHTLPLPAVTSVCCESRDVTFNAYSMRLHKEYDTRGVPITSKSQIAFISEEPYNILRTGVVMNPAVDIIQLKINVASGQSLVDLKQFAAIAANGLGDIRRVIVKIGIAMRPYQWWESARFEKWRNWGADGTWVSRSLLNLNNLSEVAVLIEGESLDKMLPTEWRDRTVSIWCEELEKMRRNWPTQWEGNMPRLRVIRELKEL